MWANRYNQYIIDNNQYKNIKRLAFQVHSILCKSSCWFRSDICHFYKVGKESSINCTKQILSTVKFTMTYRNELCIYWLKQTFQKILFGHQPSRGVRVIEKEVDGFSLCPLWSLQSDGKLKLAWGSSLI